MEQYYFINDAFNSEGPYSPSELPALGVNNDTLVWNESMTDWVPARTIPEIAEAIERYNCTLRESEPRTETPVESEAPATPPQPEAIPLPTLPPAPSPIQVPSLTSEQTLIPPVSPSRTPTPTPAPQPTPTKTQGNNLGLWVAIAVISTLLMVVAILGAILSNKSGEGATSNSTVVSRTDTIYVQERNVVQHTSPYGSTSLEGNVQGYGLHMDLRIDDNGDVTGSLYYTRYGSSNRLIVSGNYWTNGHMELDEWAQDGAYTTGCYSGTFDGRTFRGEFHKPGEERTMDFVLRAQ